jgi:hypothetical protein
MTDPKWAPASWNNWWRSNAMKATTLGRVRKMIGGMMIATLTAAPAIAAQNTNDIAARKVGEAMALDAKCNTLKISASAITAAVNSSGVPTADLLDKAGVISKTLIVRMQGSDEAAACQLGLSLYGPEGKSAMGFLIPE